MIKDILNKLHWLGHAAFRLDGEMVIYFDPFELKGGPKADLILVSHDHYDHYSPDDMNKIRKEGTIILTNGSTKEKIGAGAVALKAGDTWKSKGVEVRAVPAYNPHKQFHVKEAGGLGFIVTIEGVNIYHTGDSDFIPEMNQIETDIALIPVSGTYVMDATEGVQAALAIRPQIAIPMHYGSFIGTLDDAQKFKKMLEGKVEVVILPRE
jgi:L-ascorbate metabolism protein UlaG (beta-lactamase superfamily)